MKKIVITFLVCTFIISTFIYIGVDAYANEDNADISKYINFLYSEEMAERREAVTQLRSIGSQAVPAIEDVIEDKDSDSSTRHSAVRALEGIGGEEVLQVLIKALEDPEARVRRRALTAIEDLNIDRTSVIPYLINILNDEDDSEVKSAAISVLTQLDSEAIEAIPALMKALDEGGFEVAWPASNLLESLASEHKQQFANELALILIEKGPGAKQEVLDVITRVGIDIDPVILSLKGFWKMKNSG